MDIPFIFILYKVNFMLIISKKYESLDKIFEDEIIDEDYVCNEGAFANSEAVKDNGKYLKAIIDKLNSDGTLLFMKGAKDSKELPEDVEVHTNGKFEYVKDVDELNKLLYTIISKDKQAYDKLTDGFKKDPSTVKWFTKVRKTGQFTPSGDILKPQNLGISAGSINSIGENISGKFTSTSEIISQLDYTIHSSKVFSSVDDLFKDSIISLCNIVNNLHLDPINIDEFICNYRVEPFEKILKVTDENVLALLKDKDWKSAINKNLGEVLGAIFLLNNIEGIESIYFSNDKAEKLSDYTAVVNGKKYKMSAKAEKVKAHDPSIVALIDAIEASGTNDIDAINDVYSDNEKLDLSELKELITLLQSTISDKLVTRTQYIKLFDKFFDESGKSILRDIANTFTGSSDLESLINLSDADFCDKLDELISTNLELLQSLVNRIYSYANVKKSDKTSVDTEAKAKSLLNNKDKKQKLGLIYFPLIMKLVNILNNKFTKADNGKVSVFTAVCRHYFKEYRQIYFDISLKRNGPVFTLRSIDLGDTDWTITPGGVTSQRPFNDRLSIKAAKK